jgi:hypothetical protein
MTNTIPACIKRGETITIREKLKRYLLTGLSSLTLLLLVLQAQAQVQTNSAPPGGGDSPPEAPGPVTGPTSVLQGLPYSYSVTQGAGTTSLSWILVPSNAGTIGSTTPNGGVQITWSPGFSGGVVIGCTAINSYGINTAPHPECDENIHPFYFYILYFNHGFDGSPGKFVWLDIIPDNACGLGPVLLDT